MEISKSRWYSQLYVQVLIGIVIGAAIGYFMPDIGAKLQPFADGFIKLIKMLLAPIIFGTVVVGIAKMGSIKEVGRIGVKALIYFEILSTIALVVGLIVVNIVKPGVGMNINVNATWRVIRSVDPLLRLSDAGRAVVVSSGSAHSARAFWAPYAASKAAVEALAPMIDRGLKVKSSQLREKFGLETPEGDDEVLGPQVKPTTTPPVEAAASDDKAQNRRQARAVNRTQDDDGKPADRMEELAAEAMAGWTEDLDPMVEPFERLAAASNSYAEFEAGIADAVAGMDASVLARTLGAAFFKARAHGDVHDDPED